MITRNRIRQKGKYFVLEELEGTKVLKSWTLNPDKLVEKFKCPSENGVNVSKNTPETLPPQGKSFAQSLLGVPLNEPENKTLSLTEINEHNKDQEYIRELELTLEKQRRALKELGL